jgi:hypothetical protein
MDPTRNSELKLVLEFGALNGTTMQATVQNNTNTWIIDPKKTERVEHAMSITLPTEIVLTVSGKNMIDDTTVDQTGKIIADKYIKLHSMLIDGMPVPVHLLEQKITLVTDTHQSIVSNYFGHNGTCKITLPKPNAFLQILSFSKEIS